MPNIKKLTNKLRLLDFVHQSSQWQFLKYLAVVQCDAINGGLPTYTWKIRISFVVYVIAVVTTIGELLDTAAFCFHQGVSQVGKTSDFTHVLKSMLLTLY